MTSAIAKTSFYMIIALFSVLSVASPSFSSPSSAPLIPYETADCYMCQFVVNGIENYINKNATITEIEKYVESVCTVFPSYEKICDSFIETYIPYVIESLEKEYPARVICQSMGYCV
jgi:hypothetical protein